MEVRTCQGVWNISPAEPTSPERCPDGAATSGLRPAVASSKPPPPLRLGAAGTAVYVACGPSKGSRVHNVLQSQWWVNEGPSSGEERAEHTTQKESWAGTLYFCTPPLCWSLSALIGCVKSLLSKINDLKSCIKWIAMRFGSLLRLQIDVGRGSRDHGD